MALGDQSRRERGIPLSAYSPGAPVRIDRCRNCVAVDRWAHTTGFGGVNEHGSYRHRDDDSETVAQVHTLVDAVGRP